MLSCRSVLPKEAWAMADSEMVMAADVCLVVRGVLMLHGPSS
jgi:hypothetical protein